MRDLQILSVPKGGWFTMARSLAGLTGDSYGERGDNWNELPKRGGWQQMAGSHSQDMAAVGGYRSWWGVDAPTVDHTGSLVTSMNSRRKVWSYRHHGGSCDGQGESRAKILIHRV